MRKLLLYSLLALLSAGCAEQVDLMQGIEVATRGVQEVAPEIKARSLEGAVYNEVVDAWMVPQPDPYTLENFQKAYDKLSAGKSAQTLTKAQAAEFTVAKKLKPTHYALKIYPKDEDEQWKVEMMEDVQVAYIPFDYVQLPQDEAEKLPQAKTRSIGTVSAAAFTFAEKSPYTVTYDYTESTDGGPTGPVTYQLPILYTVWPVDKPLPDDLEYVIDYEVFLPRAAAQTQSIEVMDVLENEAVSSALGVAPIEIMPAATRAGGPPYIAAAYFKTYDDTPGVQRNVPLANLQVRYSIGSYNYTVVTGPDGYYEERYSFPTGGYYRNYRLVYQDPQGRWKITTENGTTPYTELLPLVTYWTHAVDVILPKGDRQVNEIHRAVNYFFNNQTVFPKYTASGGIRIVAKSSSSGLSGGFDPSTREIRISNNNNSNAVVIGAVLHEIGHYAHHNYNPSFFIDVKKNATRMLLVESFASYAGWYLGEGYYKSLGWTKPNVSYDITELNARQYWTRNIYYIIYGTLDINGGWYSPLFVDLTDDYNQSTAGTDYPNDNIKNVPPSVIWSIITTSQTWAQCKAKLQSYVGAYYTSTEFNNWINNFDYWITNHQ